MEINENTEVDSNTKIDSNTEIDCEDAKVDDSIFGYSTMRVYQLL